MDTKILIALSGGVAASTASAGVLRTDFNLTPSNTSSSTNSLDVNGDSVEDLIFDVTVDLDPEFGSIFWEIDPGTSQTLGNFEVFTRQNADLRDISLEAGDVVGPTPSAEVGSFDIFANYSIAAIGEPAATDYKDFSLYGEAADPTAGGLAVLGFGLDLDGDDISDQFGALYFEATPFDGFNSEVTLLFAEVETSGAAYTVIPAPGGLAALAMGAGLFGRRGKRSA